ncbi:MAG: hypothetical protein GWP08_01035 [Nitrospiraceae bacterium]|nr:hypothetical protein [Nitrospiraceae bacterium]
MHIRTISRAKPVHAQDIEGVLDIITYILNIITQMVNLYTGTTKKQATA